MVVQCELYSRYYGYYYGNQQSDFYYGKIKQITSDNTQSIRQFAYNPNNRMALMTLKRIQAFLEI